MSMHTRSPHRADGFTLVESLIAITIVALAVAGPLYAASRSIIAAQQARDQLLASSLAQKGIEHARALRDDAYISAVRNNIPNATSAAWATFLNSCVSDCAPNTVANFPLFTRSVQIASISASEARVTSRVSWSSRGRTNTVTIYDSLTPWQ